MQIDTEEVAGSNPVVPTIFIKHLRPSIEKYDTFSIRWFSSCVFRSPSLGIARTVQ
jgi:hypothetical protein